MCACAHRVFGLHGHSLGGSWHEIGDLRQELGQGCQKADELEALLEESQKEIAALRQVILQKDAQIRAYTNPSTQPKISPSDVVENSSTTAAEAPAEDMAYYSAKCREMRLALYSQPAPPRPDQNPEKSL